MKAADTAGTSPYTHLTRELLGRKEAYKKPNGPHFHRDTSFLRLAAAFAKRNYLSG